MFHYQTFMSSIRLFLQTPEGRLPRLREKENLSRYRAFSLGEVSFTLCWCTRPCARANDAKIMCSRDAQCNTKELPFKIEQDPRRRSFRKHDYNKVDHGNWRPIANFHACFKNKKNITRMRLLVLLVFVICYYNCHYRPHLLVLVVAIISPVKARLKEAKHRAFVSDTSPHPGLGAITLFTITAVIIKITISSLVIGLKMSYFPVIFSPS